MEFGALIVVCTPWDGNSKSQGPAGLCVLRVLLEEGAAWWPTPPAVLVQLH